MSEQTNKENNYINMTEEEYNTIYDTISTLWDINDNTCDMVYEHICDEDDEKYNKICDVMEKYFKLKIQNNN